MDKLRIPGGAKLAHAYIAASMNADTRAELGRTLAAAMLCEDDAAPQKPCGHCRACRKTLLGIHPDVITVAPGLDSQGRKRREMTVDQVRAVAATAAVMPNEGRRKAYVIEDADTMNTQAQNALLKLLEEPPESAAFILEAANASLLLPTVRSRCEMIRANADAEALLWCTANEGMDSRRCAAMFSAAREKLADVLLGKSEFSLEPGYVAYLDALLASCGEYLRQNVGVKGVLGLLAVDGIQK